MGKKKCLIGSISLESPYIFFHKPNANRVCLVFLPGELQLSAFFSSFCFLSNLLSLISTVKIFMKRNRQMLSYVYTIQSVTAVFHLFIKDRKRIFFTAVGFVPHPSCLNFLKHAFWYFQYPCDPVQLTQQRHHPGGRSRSKLEGVRCLHSRTRRLPLQEMVSM